MRNKQFACFSPEEFTPDSLCSIVGTGAAILGGALIGGATSMLGASSAAGAARDAQATATAEQQRQFDLVRSDTAGQRQLGNDAIAQIRRMYGYGTGTPAQSAQPSYQVIDSPFGPITIPSQEQAPAQATNGAPDMSGFFTSPDYQFNLTQGQQAIDRSAAARGGLLSGRAVKEGTRYASGMAAGQYSAYMDRLMQQAGIGSTGIGASAAAGANAANQIGSAALNAGNMRGSAYMAGAEGVNNAFQGAAGNYMLSKYLK